MRLPALTVALLAALPGCDTGDTDDREVQPDSTVEPKDTFRDASPAQLRHAAAAASGADALTLGLLGAVYSQRDEPASCPRVATSGRVTTVTGGCTDEDGKRVDGTLVIDNLRPAFGDDPDIDRTAPARLTADELTLATDEGTVRFHGMTISDPTANTLAIALAVTDGGSTRRGDLVVAVDPQDVFTATAGATIEVEGLGQASVEGTWRLEPQLGAFTLRIGESSAIFDVAASTECFHYVLSDGIPRNLCNEQSGKAPVARWLATSGRTIVR